MQSDIMQRLMDYAGSLGCRERDVYLRTLLEDAQSEIAALRRIRTATINKIRDLNEVVGIDGPRRRAPIGNLGR